MVTATCGFTPPLRPKSDALVDLIQRLEQQRRAARRRQHTELEHVLREAAKLLRVMRLDEESWAERTQ